MELDPDEVGREISEWSGDVIGRFALDADSVSYGELYEAVGSSLVMAAETPEETFNPRNRYLVDLFITP